jgi:hexosaminidase
MQNTSLKFPEIDCINISLNHIIMKHLKMFLLVFLIFSLLVSCYRPHSSLEQSQLTIIPKPVDMMVKNGEFQINANTRIRFAGDENLTNEAKYLADLIDIISGLEIKVSEKSRSKNIIELSVNSDMSNPEGYVLIANKDGITIKGGSPSGIFYGIQTLRQLLPDVEEGYKGNLSLGYIEIKDEPRFKYRGLMLDVGRHFFPVEFIKKYIDLIALHKMNTFHWHLTEDQGWRIEIKKFPELTKVGAFRKETLKGHAENKPWEFDGERYGGFYTQEEIREVVEYALERHITIIPEIEMPGHSVAAIASYPHLGCSGGPYDVATIWGVLKDVYCAGNDSVFTFLEDVLDEVIALFPGKYIHIGGDECPKEKWKECPDCQARIKAEGLKDEFELQSYFIRRMEEYLLSKSRYIIGWDEILEGGLAPRATVMSWRGEKGGIQAAKQGHDVIMTPNTYVYLNDYQADPKNEPLAAGGFISLEKIYNYDPIPGSLSDEERNNILGAQANLWTEYISTTDYAEYMTFPRATALAEVLWSPVEKKDFADFTERLKSFTYHLDRLDVNYAKHYIETSEE